VLDVLDEVPLKMGGVVEVDLVGGGSEGIDLKLVDIFLREVADKLVDDERALYPALAVQDPDNFFEL